VTLASKPGARCRFYEALQGRSAVAVWLIREQASTGRAINAASGSFLQSARTEMALRHGPEKGREGEAERRLCSTATTPRELRIGSQRVCVRPAIDAQRIVPPGCDQKGGDETAEHEAAKARMRRPSQFGPVLLPMADYDLLQPAGRAKPGSLRASRAMRSSGPQRPASAAAGSHRPVSRI